MNSHSVINAYIKLTGVIIFWAINFLLIKVALPSIGPMMLTALRFVGATLIFITWARISKITLLPPPAEMPMLAIIGVLQIGAVSALSSIGLSLVPPGRASVVIYTMPIWAIPVALILNREKPLPVQLIGVALAIMGLTIFLSPWVVNWSSSTLVGYATLLSAAVCWAIGACLLRCHKSVASSMTQTIWQLLAGSFASGLCAAYFEADRQIIWNSSVWTVLFFNWLIASGLCFRWWGEALRAIPVAEAGQFVTLVPIVVLLLSAIFFNEKITAGVIVSTALITTGIVLTIRAKLRSSV